MEHVAIMKKSWKLLPKIVNGEKTIETRWYKSRIAPWDKIFRDDVVYFKDAGEKVSVRAEVENIIQIFNFSKEDVKDIWVKYREKICFVQSNLDELVQFTSTKKYAILIFLRNVEEIENFDIDKKGFGSACAWISTESVNRIKIQD